MLNEKQTTNQGRIEYIDFLRGLMLVVMTFDHLGGPVKSITFQPLGFVSAAAGFIYLSGFVYGLVYTRRYYENSFENVRTKSIKRAAVIYLYHLMVLFIIAVPFFLGLTFVEGLTVFKEKPVQSFLYYAVLVNQPSNMDILPMYIIYVLIAPYVLKTIIAGKPRLVIAISIMLWLINQIPFLQYNRLEINQFDIDLGYFNIFSWQILFFTGVFFGYFKAVRRVILPTTKWTILLAFTGSALLLFIRHMPSEMWLNGLFSYFADRSTLGIVRLTNFILIAYLIYVFTNRYPFFFNSKWLSLLGRHSIQVYAYSVCLIYFLPSGKVFYQSLTNTTAILFDLLMVSTLTLPAFLHEIAYKKFPVLKRAGL